MSPSSDLASMRVFITGATGFIGGHLTQRLHQQGATTIGLQRTPGKGRSLEVAGIWVVQGDISDHERMAVLLSELQPDTVIHAAAWLGRPPQPALAHTINVVASEHLARHSIEAGVRRFVFISSLAVYGAIGDRTVDEDTSVEPFDDPYGDSKIRAERSLKLIAEGSQMDLTIVRPGMVYGPGSPGWTVRMASWARRGLMPLIDQGRGTAFPIYIDNLIDLIVLAAAHSAAADQIFNAIDDGPVTFADFMGGYMAMVPTSRALRLPGWLFRPLLALVDPFYRSNKLSYLGGHLCGSGTVSNQNAKSLLGWEPRVGLDEGLKRSDAWLRQQGLL